MTVQLAAVVFGICFGIATCSQSSFLGSTYSQQVGIGETFLQEDREETHAESSTSLVDTPVCDAIFSDPVCFAGRRGALLPGAVPSGLVGHWDFNSDEALDSSGNGQHGVTELWHGPSPAGGGHSAMFRNSFMMVPNSPQLQSKDFTYSFWVYLLDDEGAPPGFGRSSTWCPLLRKGIHDVNTHQFASAPSLLFNHRTGHLRAQLTTSAQNVEDWEHVDSNARLLANRWVHIAMVHHSSRSTLLLYVNGILDSAMATKGTMVMNDYPLYVGGDPFMLRQCGFTVFIDELRLFSHAVPPHQLEAEAAPALGGTDPSYVRLGCLSCSLEEAAMRCPKNRHICTSVELNTGGYQVARSLGWLSHRTHVWTHAAVMNGATAQMTMHAEPLAPAESVVGLGLCCEGAP